MFCTKCGKEIPDGSAFCSACGAPVEAKEAVKAENTAENVQEAVKAENAAENVQGALQSETNGNEPEKKKKKGKAGAIIGVMAGLVAVLAVCVGGAFLFARDKVENFIHVKFDKPKEYYSYVIDRNYRNEQEVIPVSVYSEKVKAQMGIFNSAGYEKFQLKFGQRGKDFLQLANTAGVDLSWLDSVGFDFKSDVQMKNKAASASAVAYLNGEKIISGNLLVDLAKGELAMQSPELSEKFVKYVFSEEMDLEEIEETLTKMQDMMSLYPDVEFYQKKLSFYLDQYLAMVDEVEKSKESITADEMTQECMALTVTMNREKIQQFVKIIMEDLATDPEIESMVRKLAESSDQNADEFYADFKKECEEAMTQEKLDEILLSKIKLVIYVDKDSKVLGASLKVESKAEEADEETQEVKMEAFSLRDDNKHALTFRWTSKEATIVFQGNAVIKDNKLNGDYVLNVDEKQVMKLGVEEFDLEAAKKGDLIGRFKVKQGKDFDLVDTLLKVFIGNQQVKEREKGNPALVLLSSLDLSLDIAIDLQGNVCKEEIGLQDAGVDIIRLILETGLEEGSIIKLPDDAIDIENNVEEYLKGLKFGNVIEALQKANVPKEYFSGLEELEEEIKEHLEYYSSIYDR